MVTAGLARALLRTAPGLTTFFHQHERIATEAVADALGRASGLYLQRDVSRGYARIGPILFDGDARPVAAIFPSVKSVRGVFPVECSLYHDISTLLLPDMHDASNVRHHLPGMVEDMRTNAVTFGVSRATVEDLKIYLGAGEVFVAENGVSWPWWYAVRAGNEREADEDDPYFLLLGTREPRKNISCVFEMLARTPGLLRTHRLVIVGRMGWLQEAQRIPPSLEESIARGRIVFTGFVDDWRKYQLLVGAEALIYPSMFEGFGLPVAEALSVGTPCVCSLSSSLPEVGGDACFYFDPFSPDSLLDALIRLLAARPREKPEFQSACRAVRERFTWEAMLATILERLVPALGTTSPATAFKEKQHGARQPELFRSKRAAPSEFEA